MDLLTTNAVASAAANPSAAAGPVPIGRTAKGKSTTHDRESGRQLIIDQLVVWAIASSTFSLVFVGNPNDQRWRRHPFLTLVDVFAMVLVGFTALAAAKALRNGQRLPSTPIARALTALFVVLVGAYAIHPSLMGFAALFHFATLVSIASQIERRPHLLRPVMLTMMALATFEGIVAAGQSLGNHPLGLGAIGEVGDPFIPVGTAGMVPAGTMFHPYPLTGFCLVAVALGIVGVSRKLVKLPFAVFAAAGTGAMVALSASVAAAIASGAIAVSTLAVGLVALKTKRGDWRVLLVLVGFGIGFASAFPLAYDGWIWKGERATQGVETAGNGRVELVKQAGEMIKRWPLTGVGPGRYMQARDAHPDLIAMAKEDQPVHNWFMLIVVETGVLGALALAYIGWQTGRAMLRDWGPVLVVMASVSANLMFDHYLWLFEVGAVQMGVAFGVIGALARSAKVPVDSAEGFENGSAAGAPVISSAAAAV